MSVKNKEKSILLQSHKIMQITAINIFPSCYPSSFFSNKYLFFLRFYPSVGNVFRHRHTLNHLLQDQFNATKLVTTRHLYSNAATKEVVAV